MRDIGLHIRINASLSEAAEHAMRLGISFFQCFLVIKTTGTLIHPSVDDKNRFVALRRQHFGNLFMHGSYWINLASLGNNGYRALQNELRLAKQLEFTHMILHPGSAKGGLHRHDGIDPLARSLNRLLRHEHDIKIVLENTAHGSLSVGSDIEDFALLKQKLDHPEKIAFCIDTAHAYSYGYNLTDAEHRGTFIDLLEKIIGIDAIVLLHINDTTETCGSEIDKHELVGKGKIGMQALKAFALDERLIKIPLLMELPVVSHEKEEELLNDVRSWHQ